MTFTVNRKENGATFTANGAKKSRALE